MTKFSVGKCGMFMNLDSAAIDRCKNLGLVFDDTIAKQMLDNVELHVNVLHAASTVHSIMSGPTFAAMMAGDAIMKATEAFLQELKQNIEVAVRHKAAIGSQDYKQWADGARG